MKILLIAILFSLYIFAKDTDVIMGATRGYEIKKNRKKLESYIKKEIKEYRGKKLFSLGDFPENSIKGIQNIDINKYTLEVINLEGKSTILKYEDVVKLKSLKKLITLHCVEGWKADVLWEGILLKDILELASIKDKGKVIIFHAEDGYTSSLKYDYILKNNIMLAYKINGVVLPPDRGFPFQVVAESKWGYKWVRWVTKIELSNDINYKGFWENRGNYSIDGSLDKSMFNESEDEK